MPKITRRNKKDRQTIRDWFRSREGREALSRDDLMTDPYGRPISVMLPEAEVSTLGNAPRNLSKDFLEFIRYGAGSVPILGETLDYAESAYATKHGTDFFGRPMHGPLNAGITTAGIVVPNVVEKPIKAGAKVVKKALPKIGPKLKKFKSSIDWGKWNPDTPNHPELIEEYLEIERRTKADGTWMKNPDGTDFDGPPELFVQMQSKAFKEAFPDGYDKLYRGAYAKDKKGLTETARKKDGTNSSEFFSEDRKQAEEYASWGEKDRQAVGSDYAEMNSGVYELAYPKDTPRVDLNATGSTWDNVEEYNKNELLDRLEYFNELKFSPHADERDWAKQEIEFIEDALRLGEPRRVSSRAEIDEFLEKYKAWLRSKGKADSGLHTTDDIAMFMNENPDIYDRIVLRGLLDEEIGDVNIINMGSAPYPKSLKGNVGTFDLNDPNVFKALIPALGVGAVMSQKKDERDDMSYGGKISLNKRRRPGIRIIK